MPYDYLIINEANLSNGITSASYFTTDLQKLYSQRTEDTDKVFFGDNEDDIFEFSLYDSNQNLISFNRILPKITYSVINGQYKDINNINKSYSVKNPFTNYAIYTNQLLLNTQNDLLVNQSGPGLYHTLYNPIRNIAGNSNNNLFIKEISPSRTELRLSLAFDPTLNETNRLDYAKISAFADKKYIFLQIIDELISIIDNNNISNNFAKEYDNINYVKYCQMLGLKNPSQLEEFMISVYNGYQKIINLSTDPNSQISQLIRFTGIKEQLKNFQYTYNVVEFTQEEILTAFQIITKKVSQDAILQKTTLLQTDLDELLGVFDTIIYQDYLLPKIINLLNNYYDRFYALYKNALNFGNGNLVKILNHSSYINSVDGRVNIQVKLDSPLPYEYNLKTICWISNISLAPIYFKVNLYANPISRKVYLNGVNFTVEVPQIKLGNEESSTFDDNTLFSTQVKLKQKINDLLINYDNFDNFINFSSAELRSKIAKSKINKYISLDQSKLSIKNAANNTTNLSISASYSINFNDVVSSQINLLNTFDEYEAYLFYNQDKIETKIEDGVEYDKSNYNSLFYQLPEYIKIDEDSADYVKFTAMVGHFFDNILVYIKKFPKTYPISYNDNNDWPKNYIEEILNSFNWNITNLKFNKSDLNQLLFTNFELNGGLSSSYFDYAKSIFNRLLNNLNYIYKTKGNSNSFKLVRNIFGIPSELIDVKEYTSPDILTNRNLYYDFDDVIYATKFDSNNQFINFNFTSSEYNTFFSSQWTFGKSTYIGQNNITQSYIEKFTGISAIELSFRSDNFLKYDYNDRIPILKKIRNKNIDWQLYLKKTKQQQSAQLIFEMTPVESAYNTSSIVSSELPFFNGNFYTILINRKLDDSIIIDKIAPDIKTINTITQSVTEIASEKYAPHIYTLSINQYYGSRLSFTDTQTKTILYNQNKYFGSGSYYIGNYSSSVNFYGNIDKIKVQKNPLDFEDFNEHCYNINSISVADKNSVYSNLYYLWSFDTPVNLWSNNSYAEIPNQNSYYKNYFYAYGFNRNTISRGAPYCDTISTDKFPYQFDKINLKQSINSNKYGPNYKSKVGVNKITQTVSSNLVPYDYSTSTQDVFGSDSNLLGFYITPYNFLNNKIEDFLGKEGINNIIGDPKYLLSKNYSELKQVQESFASSNQKYIYPQEFYTTYKFYIDFSIFDFVEKLKPSRSTLKKGLLLEPSIFERTKITYKDIITNTTDTNNSINYINFNNFLNLTTSIVNTNNLSNNATISCSKISKLNQDNDTYNYSRLLIEDRIDNRDFIYSKYGKFVNMDSDGFKVRDNILYHSNDYYSLLNDNSKIIKFTASYNQVQSIGSGSGFIYNQVTGSKYLLNKYSGSLNNGYSNRHLSKFIRVGTRESKRAISGSKYTITNGVKIKSSPKFGYYIYTKGLNTPETTVNRQGVLNGSLPVIQINGFLNVDIESNNFSVYGVLTGSAGNPTNLLTKLPLTCSTCTSASLNNYIKNL